MSTLIRHRYRLELEAHDSILSHDDQVSLVAHAHRIVDSADFHGAKQRKVVKRERAGRRLFGEHNVVLCYTPNEPQIAWAISSHNRAILGRCERQPRDVHELERSSV